MPRLGFACHRCDRAPALRGKYIFCQACADLPGAPRYAPHWTMAVVAGCTTVARSTMGGITVGGPLVGSAALDREATLRYAAGRWADVVNRSDCTRALLIAIPPNGIRVIVRDELFVERLHDYVRDREGLPLLVSPPRRQPNPHPEEVRRARRVDDFTDEIWRSFGPAFPHGTTNATLVWTCDQAQLPAIPLDSCGRK